MKKRFLSVFLVLLVLFSLIPASFSFSDYKFYTIENPDLFDYEYSLSMIEDPMALLYGYFEDRDFSFDEARDAYFEIYETLGRVHRF